MQPAEDPAHGSLGAHQRFQFPLDLTGREDTVEHHPVRAEDAGKRSVELLLDAKGGILELAAGLLERRQDPAPFAGDLITRDRRGLPTRVTDTEPTELHWVWEGWKDRDHDPRHTRQLLPRGVSREARS